MSKIRPGGSMAARGRPSALGAAQGVLPSRRGPQPSGGTAGDRGRPQRHALARSTRKKLGVIFGQFSASVGTDFDCKMQLAWMNSSFPRGITDRSNFEPPPCVGCVDFTTLAIERSKPAQLRAEDTARAVYFTVRAKNLKSIVFKEKK